jgi:DNA polymerase
MLDDVLNALLRPVFVARPGHKLLILDYGSVEARGVAWVAGESKLLDIFADTSRDPYCEMAERIFGRPVTKADKRERHVGKEVVLGSGYGMSAPKFAARCKLLRIDLDAAGTTAEACIAAYRDTYTRIAGRQEGKWRRGGVWKAYQAAAFAAVQEGGTHTAGRCQFALDGRHLAITLPSGRRLIYRNASVQDRVPGYCKMLGIPEVAKPTLIYSHPRKYEGTLYGGLICENIVQAVCRDLLAAAMVRAESAGLPVVLHVHDEMVCEVPSDTAADSLAAAARIMSAPPVWADGFPIVVEGYTGTRYTKTPFAGETEVKVMGGKICG